MEGDGLICIRGPNALHELLHGHLQPLPGPDSAIRGRHSVRAWAWAGRRSSRVAKQQMGRRLRLGHDLVSDSGESVVVVCLMLTAPACVRLSIEWRVRTMGLSVATGRIGQCVYQSIKQKGGMGRGVIWLSAWLVTSHPPRRRKATSISYPMPSKIIDHHPPHTQSTGPASRIRHDGEEDGIRQQGRRRRGEPIVMPAHRAAGPGVGGENDTGMYVCMYARGHVDEIAAAAVAPARPID